MKDSHSIGKADLHIHSKFSDGAASIEEILDHVQTRTNLSVIAITDHDTIDGALLASSIVRHGNYRFEVIIGQEITSKHGDVIGLYLSKRVTPNQSFDQTVIDIIIQGGLVVIPHPNLVHFHVHPERIFQLLKKNARAISGIELSSFIVFDQNDAAKWLSISKRFAISPIGASDSHQLSTIGRAVTYFAGQSASNLKTCLTQGKTTAHFQHLTGGERLRFFQYALKFNLKRHLMDNARTVDRYVQKTSAMQFALRTTKHYLGLSY